MAAPAKTLVGCTQTATAWASSDGGDPAAETLGKTDGRQRQIDHRQRDGQRLAGVPGEAAVGDIDRQDGQQERGDRGRPPVEDPTAQEPVDRQRRQSAGHGHRAQQRDRRRQPEVQQRQRADKQRVERIAGGRVPAAVGAAVQEPPRPDAVPRLVAVDAGDVAQRVAAKPNRRGQQGQGVERSSRRKRVRGERESGEG